MGSGIIPKKSLGQNFLINPGICQKIINLLRPDANDSILEIGPGQGALTKLLAQTVHKNLVLLEKDETLLKIHKVLGNINIINMDALRVDWQRFGNFGPWLICGNLPYNIASPLIWEIVAHASYKKLVFMVQKEVGERLTAQPGDSHYGMLSVWVQSFAKPKYEFTVKPGSFFPRPKVDSAIISFLPRPAVPLYPQFLERLIKNVFQQRRKQLGGILKKCGLGWLSGAFRECGIAETMRPEEISPEIYEHVSIIWHDQEAKAGKTEPACFKEND